MAPGPSVDARGNQRFRLVRREQARPLVWRALRLSRRYGPLRRAKGRRGLADYHERPREALGVPRSRLASPRARVGLQRVQHDGRRLVQVQSTDQAFHRFSGFRFQQPGEDDEVRSRG